MKNRFLNEGMRHFADHEILEMLLYYAIPKKDTNALAHILLERFGSLHLVFEADYQELCSVEGVGKHTAMLLRMIPDLLRAYQVSQTRGKLLMLKEPESIVEYLRPRFFGRTREEMFLLCFDDGGGLVYDGVLFEGTVNAVQVHMRELIGVVLRVGATNVILAHNHPKGLAIPSSDDLAVTYMVDKGLRVVGARLVDHFIVTVDDAMSMRASGYFAGFGDKT